MIAARYYTPHKANSRPDPRSAIRESELPSAIGAGAGAAGAGDDALLPLALQEPSPLSSVKHAGPRSLLFNSSLIKRKQSRINF